MDLTQLDMEIKVSTGLHSCFGGARGRACFLVYFCDPSSVVTTLSDDSQERLHLKDSWD